MPALGRSSRERPVDYVAICHTIADTYPNGIAHGLQKDAIQNSLDARKSKKATVRVEFQVIENSIGRFLTFTDSNTKGLTGKVISNIDDYKSLRADDHWARFEAFAFTKSDPDALGARGQGKFIFLCASSDYKMFYDTLRTDEVYRLGATQATDTGCPIHPDQGEKWEDETAKKELATQCGLPPLTEIGTRIIVCNPRDEVLDEIANGDFVAAIQETWFRAIEKKQLEVWITASTNRVAVELPSTYRLPPNDSKKVKTWKYRQDFKEVAVSDDFKIKNFHAAYLSDADIPEAMQGIAVLQNGMKITALQMDVAPSDMRKKVTGFIEFDTPLDRELRKGHNQYPNHYDLKWRSKIPRAIKLFIQSQLERFGREKLGIGEDPRERQKRTRDNAEKEAMKMLMRHAPGLNFAGHKRGPIPPVPPVPPPPPPHKDSGISMTVEFPDNGKKPRVDWGDEMRVSAFCFNKTANSISGKLAIRILQADALIDELTSVSIEVPGNSVGSRTVRINNGDAFVISFDEARYKRTGEYRVRAILTDIMSGAEDAVTRRFWLNEDPPQKLPFNLEPSPLANKEAWIPRGDIENDPTIVYNTEHPEFKRAQSGDEQVQADYLLNICLDGALHFILSRPLNEGGEPDYSPLDTAAIVSAAPDSAPEKVHDEISRYKAEVLWSVYED